MRIPNESKDLGHFACFVLNFIRMLVHLQMSAHLVNFIRLRHVTKCYLNIGTMPIESVPHPLYSVQLP